MSSLFALGALAGIRFFGAQRRLGLHHRILNHANGTADYFSHAKERLKEQATDLAGEVEGSGRSYCK